MYPPEPTNYTMKAISHIILRLILAYSWRVPFGIEAAQDGNVILGFFQINLIQFIRFTNEMIDLA